MKIVWLDLAKKMLTEVYEYHEDVASRRIARKLIKGIVKETLTLKEQPHIGQVETSLEDRTKQFRYLIYKSYKILYQINDDLSQIEIVDVFDARQKPIKIQRGK